MEVDSPPNGMKPDTGDEAMGRSSRRTSRGERGQRAGTDQPRNLGDPAGERRGSARQPPAGTHNRERPESGIGEAHSSEELR